MRHIPIDIHVHGRNAHALTAPHSVLPDSVIEQLRARYGAKLVVMRGRGHMTAVFPHRVRIEVSATRVVCHYHEGSSPKSRDLDVETIRGALAACCHAPLRKVA